MSKTVGANLLTHMAQEVTTWAILLKLTRVDLTTYGFTNHDSMIQYGGVDYESDDGFLPTGIENKSGLSVDNLEIVAFLNSTKITDSDIFAGLFDFARIDIWKVNYNSLGDGHFILAGDWKLGEIQIKENQFSAEIRSKKQHLDQKIVGQYQPECTAQLGDTECGVTIGTYTVTGTLTGVTDNRTFVDTSRVEAVDRFAYGVLTWTSGNNNGYSMEVKSFTPATDTIVLYEDMPNTVQVGDTYSMTWGCDKQSTTCNSFANIWNYRGHPSVPTYDKVLQRPD